MGQTIGVLDCIYENMLEKYGPWQRRVLMVGLECWSVHLPCFVQCLPSFFGLVSLSRPRFAD